MAAPAILKLERQGTEGDCGICCLSMLLQLPYVEVSGVAQQVGKAPLKTGLKTGEMKKIALKLGVKLTSTKPATVNLDEETGILLVRFKDKVEHAVILFEGVVYDPYDGLLYDNTTYLSTKGAHVLNLLRS